MSQPFENLLNELRDWVASGKIPNSFLRAVLRNDLVEAVTRASPHEALVLVDIVDWLRGYAPEGSYGSARVFSDYPMYLRALERQTEESKRMEGVSL